LTSAGTKGTSARVLFLFSVKTRREEAKVIVVLMLLSGHAFIAWIAFWPVCRVEKNVNQRSTPLE